MLSYLCEEDLVTIEEGYAQFRDKGIVSMRSAEKASLLCRYLNWLGISFDIEEVHCLFTITKKNCTKCEFDLV